MAEVNDNGSFYSAMSAMLGSVYGVYYIVGYHNGHYLCLRCYQCEWPHVGGSALKGFGSLVLLAEQLLLLYQRCPFRCLATTVLRPGICVLLSS